MEHKRSLFWPLFFIATGVIWLLVASGTIPSSNLWALMYIWPFVLIAAGVGIILRSFWSYASIFTSVVIIGGAVLAIVYAPQLGWANPSLTGVINLSGPFLGPGVRGSGIIKTETREVSGFHAIELDYPAEVLVKQGTKESVKIEADDNLLPELLTEVQNGTLEIDYKRHTGRHVNPTQVVKITVVVKELDSVRLTSAGELVIDGLESEALDVSLSGAGNLDMNEINVKDLRVSLSGAGSLRGSGTADQLDLHISGFGDFKGAELHVTGEGLVSISGAGSATVWVDKELTAHISGAGSVSYYGSPTLTKGISGVGSVNHLGDK